VTPIDRTTAKDMRDVALILVGFASALHRSELTALTLADVETKPAGVLLHVRRSKTDPEGHGQVVGVAHGQHALTDPVAALAAWSEARGLGPGPLFVSLRNKVLTDEPTSGEAVARMLAPAPAQPACPPNGSPATPCEPATPPPPLPPGCRSTGSHSRLDTNASPPSSTDTSGQRRRWRRHPARTSASERPLLRLATLRPAHRRTA
jgi:hypothetical protein